MLLLHFTLSCNTMVLGEIKEWFIKIIIVSRALTVSTDSQTWRPTSWAIATYLQRILKMTSRITTLLLTFGLLSIVTARPVSHLEAEKQQLTFGGDYGLTATELDSLVKSMHTCHKHTIPCIIVLDYCMMAVWCILLLIMQVFYNHQAKRRNSKNSASLFLIWTHFSGPQVRSKVLRFHLMVVRQQVKVRNHSRRTHFAHECTDTMDTCRYPTAHWKCKETRTQC